jgi:anti-sigma regulatory factor (Ser/Thr protein kinase)
MPLLIALELWAGLAGLFAVQAVVVNGEAWSDSLAHSYAFWLPWLFLLPAVVWLALRFPLERPHIRLQIGIHVAGCAGVIVLSQVACRTVMSMPAPPHRLAGSSAPRDAIAPGMRAAPDLMIYLVTLSACVAFAHYQKSQERERRAIELEARLAQARLQALRMQINPHFLFNTLNAISTLVHTSPHTADDMITDLSELFRVSLENSEAHEVSLARERELLQHYLAIEQRRFGPRLQIEQSMAPEVLAARVPTLILQPLVENAIRHGVESRTDAGRIAIQAWRTGDQLHLSVSDNGKKPVDLSLLEPRSRRAGIGLANTQARLEQLYGPAQSLAVGTGEWGGWKVTITLPFRSP